MTTDETRPTKTPARIGQAMVCLWRCACGKENASYDPRIVTACVNRETTSLVRCASCRAETTLELDEPRIVAPGIAR